MCGIYGILSTEMDLLNQPSNLELISKSLIHRGPDQNGFVVFPELSMGTRRLAIISANSNEQPVHNEDSQVWAVMNGEIYNYKELRTDLSNRHQLAQEGDVEVVVHLYEELGECFAASLEGMFAIALWDNRKKKLILARDRIGEKPLYTWQDGKNFIFASELQSILKIPHIHADLDIDSMIHFINYGYVPGPSTIIKNISKLQPAYFRVIDSSLISYSKPYWKIPEPLSDSGLNEKGWVDLLDNSLRTACLRQYQAADQSPAVFLSGGLDSSLVTAYLSESGYQLNAFTISYPDDSNTADSFYATQLANYFGIHQTQVMLTDQHFVNKFSEMISYIDEPCADPSSLPIYLLSSVVSKDTRTVLTGGGADELFAGYPEHLLAADDYRHSLHPDFVLNPLFFQTSLLSKSLTRNLYTPQIQALFNVDAHPAWSPVWSEVPPLGVDPLWYILSTDLTARLPDLRLSFGDRMTMAHSIEARSPFLDVKVVETAMRMPSHLKVDANGGKRPLRLLAKQHLPQALISRPKSGLRNPMFDKNFERVIPKIWDSLKNNLPDEFLGLFAPGIIEQVQINALENTLWQPLQLFWRMIILAAWLNKVLCN